MIDPVLAGRVAIVTGVTSGVGAATFELFAELGMRVWGLARSGDQGRETQARLCAAGLDAHFLEGDVTLGEDRARLVEAALGKDCRVDILVNNAAMNGVPPLRDVEQWDDESWEAIQTLNLRAPRALAAAVLPSMKARADGVILNIASFNAVFGVAGMSAYNVSKAALVHLTRCIAVEGAAHNVRANAILLGGTASDRKVETSIALAQAVTGSDRRPSQAAIAAMQAPQMQPRDVAGALVALCRPEARLITGADIAIDGASIAGGLATRAIRGSCAAFLGG